MASAARFDVALVGGGVMGCTAALHLARAGMRVVLYEKGGLCREASGRNAGTLTMFYTRAALIPYALKGRELWRDAARWMGRDAGFRDRHGLELAFSADVLDDLERQHKLRAEAGAPIEIIGGNRAREIEPELSDKVVGAAYCLIDGYADSYLIGRLFHAALVEAGVVVRAGTPVEGVAADGSAWRVLGGDSPATAATVVLTGGVWLGRMGRWFGIDFPIACRVNQGTASERLRPIFTSIIRIPNELSLKQTDRGTVLMGGGGGEHWVKDPDSGPLEEDPVLVMTKMAGSAAAAQKAIPALAEGRVLRTWTGYEAFTPDNQPLIGPMPGAAGVYVLGCLRSGFTIGPCVGRLMADVLLGREPELPLFRPEFDPARVVGMKPFDPSQAAQAA